MKLDSGKRRKQISSKWRKVSRTGSVRVILTINSTVNDDELDQTREYLSEYEAHLEALENGEPFVPRLTRKSKGKSSSSRGTKRKHSTGKRPDSPKRRRSEALDDDDAIEISDDSSDGIESDKELDSDKCDSDNEDNGGSMSDSGSRSGSNPDNKECDMEELTKDNLKVKIDECQQAVKVARENKTRLRNDKKEAVDRLATLKKNLAKLQREKNAFCSLKRSEVVL